MTKDEAMKLALEVLDDSWFLSRQSKKHVKQYYRAIAALEAALEQREQAPVAWVGVAEGGYQELDWDKEDLQREYPFVHPLYFAPPQREWVGLTDEEIVKASIGNVEGEHMLPHSFAREIEKLLREKNRD